MPSTGGVESTARIRNGAQDSRPVSPREAGEHVLVSRKTPLTVGDEVFRDVAPEDLVEVEPVLPSIKSEIRIPSQLINADGRA